jgi:alpha-beta hydrolase superfamily lysophospholipase
MRSFWACSAIFRKPVVFLLMVALTACSRVFFYPDKWIRLKPDQLGLPYRDVWLQTPDNVKLHGWFLGARGTVRGTILFLHGNAENISSHIYSVAWLPAEGFQVFLVDYRGYGYSSGKPRLPDVFTDLDTAFRWLETEPGVRGLPLFLLGQSLGANLAAYHVGQRPALRQRLSGLVLDAPFASYRALARDKLGSFWLTWPLQYPLSRLIDDRYSPIRNIARISPLPLLVVASQNDSIIPAAHSVRLFEAAGEPKTLLLINGAHISTFTDPENRQKLLRFLLKLQAEKASTNR